MFFNRLLGLLYDIDNSVYLLCNLSSLISGVTLSVSANKTRKTTTHRMELSV